MSSLTVELRSKKKKMQQTLKSSKKNVILFCLGTVNLVRVFFLLKSYADQEPAGCCPFAGLKCL